MGIAKIDLHENNMLCGLMRFSVAILQNPEKYTLKHFAKRQQHVRFFVDGMGNWRIFSTLSFCYVVVVFSHAPTTHGKIRDVEKISLNNFSIILPVIFRNK